jgi:hypothetical protein
MNLRRLSAYRKPRSRLGRLVLDEDTNHDNKQSRSDIELWVAKREEAPRVLKALLIAAQRTIEKSRTGGHLATEGC